MATERGTPARSRVRTAVRLRSCRMRPGRAWCGGRPRDDASGLPLLGLGDGALRFERRPELRRHHERAALEVFGRARVESHDARLEIDLTPLEREHLASD